MMGMVGKGEGKLGRVCGDGSGGAKCVRVCFLGGERGLCARQQSA